MREGVRGACVGRGRDEEEGEVGVRALRALEKQKAKSVSSHHTPSLSRDRPLQGGLLVCRPHCG